MKTILNIIKLDLIAMKAKKFSLGKIFIAAFLLSVVLGMITPLLLIPFLMVFGALAVPGFLDLENRYDGETTLSILPVTRRDIVIARYGLITLALTVTGGVSLIVMKISQTIDLIHFFERSSDANESLSGILKMNVNDSGLFMMIVCLLITISLIFSASQLGGFFKTGKNSNGKSMLRMVLIVFILWCALGLVVALEASSLEVKVFSTAISIIIDLFTSLSSPYNGALLDIFMLIIAYGFVFYKAACSVIDYEALEL